MKIFYYTFGCKVNSFETAATTKLMEQNGFETVDSAQLADIAVVNSCTVTANADRKTRQFLRRLRRENPNLILVLSGCLPEAHSDGSPAFDEAEIVVGNTERERLPALISDYLQQRERIVSVTAHEIGEQFDELEVDIIEGHTRAFLKIEDGCDRFCAYCIVPYARGRVRSASMEYIKRSAERFAANGYREIVLSGINLASFGRGEAYDLADAVDAAAVSGIERVRISSVEPDLMSDKILNQLARQPKFCPHFHLALQSGCDETLKRMGRRYDSAQYLAVVEKIRGIFDNPTFTTDVMVGFPQESDEEFAQSCEFVKSAGFIKCHIFPYSIRPGTRAAEMSGQLSREIKDRRAQEMAAAAAESRDRIFAGFIGNKVRVIAENGKRDGYLSGYTDRYIPVEFPANGRSVREIVELTITGMDGEHCTAE